MNDVLIGVRIKKTQPQAQIPVYATAGAAGADIYACLQEDMIIAPGERVGVPTGIAIELPDAQVVALVFARSGLASKQGLALSNGVGVIDSDFRGEIKVLMINLGNAAVTVRHGDRIAQIAFMPVRQAAFIEAQELAETQRGEGGFGSTGK
ncbi:dUTP diphosphatase [Dehalobacter sp. DCM]|uniref:dUTP diphosphatase n=1 Tax=Dehalobacter sp. DCM TaxID=2907827 RepID=UPI003081B78C|nr:dUTP diphosphatase [Dehalobacter sp. DCM]